MGDASDTNTTERTRRPIDAATEAAVRAFLARAGEHHDIAAAYLFGSRARQTHRPDSDADVAVILNGPVGDFVETKLEMADLAFDVLLETGVLVQALPIRVDEWERPEDYRNPELMRNIRREGVRL